MGDMVCLVLINAGGVNHYHLAGLRAAGGSNLRVVCSRVSVLYAEKEDQGSI